MSRLFRDENPETRLALSDANVKRVEALERLMLAMEATPRGARMDAWAALERDARDALGGRGISAKSLQRIYADWRREGWRALTLNYATRPTQLPPAFVHFWKTLVLSFGVRRGARQAHAELRRRFDAWRGGDRASAIPGYDAVPERNAFTLIPEGWSYKNLTRAKFMPTAAETAASKGGALAARAFKAPVCVRRAAEPGMCYQFDDMWHDQFAVVPGFAAAVRPLEFAVEDESSACRVLYGVRPRLPRKDGTNEQLQGCEMALLLATLVSTIGWHRDGCVLKIENGTATVDAEQEAVLARISGGKIRVERGAMLSGAAFDGGFSGQARGNFKHKAALESSHSLIHSASSSIPGYAGNNRTVPEDSAGLVKARERLYRRAEKFLPPALLDKISLGVPGWDEYNRRYGEVVERVNRRTDHALSDWGGREVAEYRIDAAEDFRPVTAQTSAEVLAIVRRDPALFRLRKMSPREVFSAGSGALVRADYREAALLCRKFWTRVKVAQDRTISFKDGYGVFRKFYARIRREHSVEDLRAGLEVFAFTNPMCAGRGVLIFDDAARFIGESTDEIERLDPADKAAIERACGIAEGSFRDAIRSVNSFAKPKRDARRRAIVELDALAAETDSLNAALARAKNASRERVTIESDDDFDGALSAVRSGRADSASGDEDDLLF